MKVSLSWIKDYVKLPDELDLSRLAYDLTMSTVEVEGAESLTKKYENIIVGEVKEVIPHPNADKLRICHTDIGNGEIKEIVCGGSNLNPGMKVVVACPGAMVRWHGEGEPVEIKNAKLRGVESFGMICASSELEMADLFPAKEEAEIMDITEFEAKAGTPITAALDIDDIILEIDNKSMTNRPDLWGHYGIAREIAALYNLPFIEIKNAQIDIKSDFNVCIQNTDKCPRYIGVEIDGMSIKTSPYLIKSRIWRVGMRPINALVDVTNYVMLATGQPTHAFDSDNIAGHITVRSANKDEKLLLLNDKDLKLDESDLVISDEKGAVALAGVMGGAKDSVLPSTNKIILEVANFEAKGIRKTALKYDNRTEASSRYEKGIDPERCDLALSLALDMFKEIYPNMNITGYCDKYEKKLERCQIDVSLKWLESRLGKHISNDELKSQLSRLGFDICFNGDNMHVIAPTWRSTGDVSIPADIMEEVARMYGYENFEPTSITTSFDGTINQLDVDLDRKIREYLAFRCGMREIMTYPWMEDTYVKALIKNTDEMLRLPTPPSPSESYLRSSLIPNICQAIVKNESYFTEMSIFEVAQIFKDKEYTTPYDAREKLPYMHKNLGGALASKDMSVYDLFRKAKGILEYMSSYTHMQSLCFSQTSKPTWADDNMWLNICLDDKVIGNIALLAGKASIDCGIKNLKVIMFELDMDMLKPLKSRTNKFEHLAEYPMIDYDVSLLFNTDTKWEDIKNAIDKKIKNDELLNGVSFVDEYHGKQIPEGKKSVTIRLVIGSNKKTLTSDEIDACASSVIKYLIKNVGAEQRIN